MEQNLIKIMAKELATKVNKIVNIPLIGEEDEQQFFELVILMVLDILVSKLGSKFAVQK
jgi:hypothetical protein